MNILSKCLILLLLAIFVGANGILADTVLLENQETVKGKIISATNEIITIETDSGQVLELPTSKIKLINYGKGGISPVEEPGIFMIYLEGGEVIKGKITQFTDEFITVESKEGYGALEIPTAKVIYITSTKEKLKMGQRNGIGYVQRLSTIDAPAGVTTYSSNQISYKFFLDDQLFGDILLAYGNASYNNNKLQVLAIDYKMGWVFKTIQNMLFYYGGSIGYLQIVDDASNIDGSGTGYSVFAGAEMFFPSLPNLGFSAELGYGMKKAGDFSSSELSVSTFPSFSVHYYF